LILADKGQNKYLSNKIHCRLYNVDRCVQYASNRVCEADHCDCVSGKSAKMDSTDGEGATTNEEEPESSVNGDKDAAVEKLSDSVLKDDSVVLFEAKLTNGIENLSKANSNDAAPVPALHNGDGILLDNAIQASTTVNGILNSVETSPAAVLALSEGTSASVPQSQEVATSSNSPQDQTVEELKPLTTATEDVTLSGRDAKEGLDELEEVRLSETSPLTGELNSESNSPEHQSRYRHLKYYLCYRIINHYAYLFYYFRIKKHQL
jgi:hypothetical protein